MLRRVSRVAKVMGIETTAQARWLSSGPAAPAGKSPCRNGRGLPFWPNTAGGQRVSSTFCGCEPLTVTSLVTVPPSVMVLPSLWALQVSSLEM